MSRTSCRSVLIQGSLAVMSACALSSLASAVEVSLTNLSQTYDGQPRVPTLTTVPAGLPVQLTYRATTNPVVPTLGTVFDNVPNPLALSYSSLGYNAQKIWAVGNYLSVGGSNRRLAACEATLVTWAKADDFPALAAANPAGYYHPVTFILMRRTASGGLVSLAERTQSVLVPWRPTVLPDGSAYPSQGHAFQATCDFPSGITLPGKIMMVVAFNTSNTGFSPIGTPGPYDLLNVALHPSTPSAGADADPGAFLRVRSQGGVVGAPEVWEYPITSYGSMCPLFRLRAWSDVTTSPAIAAGSYQIQGSLPDSDYAGGILGTLAVAKAPAVITLTKLAAVYDGTPHQAEAFTTPSGLALATSYAGGTAPPVTPGTYPVVTIVADPNYEGIASATLSIKPSFLSWSEGMVASGSIPAGESGANADPDNDGVSNLAEYAFAYHPGVPQAGRGVPNLNLAGGQLTYRRNPQATELVYQVEYSSDCKNWLAWQPTAADETLVQESESFQVVKVTLPAGLTTGPRKFYRITATR